MKVHAGASPQAEIQGFPNKAESRKDKTNSTQWLEGGTNKKREAKTHILMKMHTGASPQAAIPRTPK